MEISTSTWMMVAFIVGMIVSIIGMTAALLVAGFEQTLQERAIGGSTWQAYIDAQEHPWFKEAMLWRLGFGVLFFVSYIILVYDLLTIKPVPVKEEEVETELGAVPEKA